MAYVDVSQPLDLIAPGDPRYITALNALGYQFGEATPIWVFDGLPPVYAPQQPPSPQPPSPTTVPPVSALPPAQPLSTPGVVTVTVPRQGGGFLSDLNPFGDIAGRLVGALGDALGAAFEATAAVANRIAGTVRDLAQATLPTIEELATAVASTATGALNFLADNLTDMADFGRTLAGALVEPLYALLDATAEKFTAALLGLLATLVEALGRFREHLLAGATLERVI